ncbi:LCP family protein [Actinomycetospora sp. CA-101289]|uniref:LCP family protein n=1 Tax=Actinomycetospora sp. CA-101289 TaxID=3239893 RepID=UPI003D989BD8
MTDDRAGDPARGSGPGADGADAGRADGSARSGPPPSVPFRIPVNTPVRVGRAPTMVPLTRKRGPRLGLRPPGAALVTAPTPLATEADGGVPPPPSKRSPVDAVTLPAGRHPVLPSAPRPEEPPTVVTAHPARAPLVLRPAAPRVPPPPDDVEDDPEPEDLDQPADEQPDQDEAHEPHDPEPGDPVESPAVRHVRAASAAAAARPVLGPPPVPHAPAEPPPVTTAAATTTAGATSAATTAAPRRATATRADATDWAATSAVLASAGARVTRWRRGWTWPRTLRVFTATCAVLVVVVCGLAWGAASWVEAAVRQIGALDPDSSAIQDAAAQVGDQNFLVVGSDSRAGAPPSEDAGDTADVPGARTDTIMIVHVPEDRSAVTVVSFPRDLEITRPACERWDPVSGAYSPQMLPPTPRVKLNSAYAAGGPRCVTRAVQELSGLAVNRFLGVDFQGFEGMVDAVRGVPICVEQPVRDSILGPIVPQAGPTVLNGRQALDFVRARHVEGDPSSDYGRIQRQQRFLGALLRSVLSAGTLLDPSRLEGLVTAISRSTFGENIGSDQLLALSQSLGSLDPRTVSFVTVPTTGVANDRGNEVLRRGEERALFSALIDDRPLPGAGATAPAAPAAPAPAPAQVRLVDARSPAGEGSDGGSRDGEESSDRSSDGGNDGGDEDRGDDAGDGDGDDGGDEERRFAAPALPRADRSEGPSADAVAERLRSAGFTVVSEGTAAGAGRGTTIRYSPDQAAAASALSTTVPGAALEPIASAPGTLVLTLGDDFDGSVRADSAPAGAGSSAPVNPTITAADASCT